jgi:hypothetical protein
MSNSIFKMKFKNSANQLNDYYDRLSDLDKERISELNTESFFDWEEEGGYNCVLITTNSEINEYSKILSENFIYFDLDDISIDILRFNHVYNDIKSKIKKDNIIKYDLFLEDLNKWIFENLEIDLVLDRISEVGMNSLSDIEKEFLKLYSYEKS